MVITLTVSSIYYIQVHCTVDITIGIPMGTNAGPHMANIYLHQYEDDYFHYLYINNMKGEVSKL